MAPGNVMGSRLLVSRALVVSGLAAAAVLLAACGGGAGDGSGTPPALPSRTGTVEASVTGSLPSVTRTLPTRSTTEAETTEAETTEAETTEAETTEAETTEAETTEAETTEAETTEAETTEAETTEAETTEAETTDTPASGPTSPPPGEDASSDTTSTPSSVWWLLAALLVAMAVAIPLLVRARRRRAWRAELAAAEQEIDWFVRVLLAELQQSRSAAEVRGGWAVGEPRVAAVEDQLTALEATAHDDEGRARAVELRDGVRLSRDRIRVVAESGSDNVARDLAAVSADLAATLGQPPPAG